MLEKVVLEKRECLKCQRKFRMTEVYFDERRVVTKVWTYRLDGRYPLFEDVGSGEILIGIAVDVSEAELRLYGHLKKKIEKFPGVSVEDNIDLKN